MGSKIRLHTYNHIGKRQPIFKRRHNNVNRPRDSISYMFRNIDSIAITASIIVIDEYVVGG